MSLRQRLPTSVVLLSLIYALVQYAPAWMFFALLQVFVLAALAEFLGLARRRGHRPRTGLAFLFAGLIAASFLLETFTLEAALFTCLLVTAFFFVMAVDAVEKLPAFPSAVALTFFGAVYLSFTLNYMYWLRLRGPGYLFFLFLVIFVGDTGAYFVGRPFGRRKMTPIASPNKTWEGSAAGVLSAGLTALGARYLLFPELPLWTAVASGALIHVAAQAADPLESLFKRSAGVKDSSNALPGHGGFLDRVDSLTLAGPLLYYLARYFW